MPFKGHSAYDPQAEIDFAIDANQDALEIGAADDVLMVSPAVVWKGRRAADPQEVDLAIDSAGDLLAIDAAGNVLEISRTGWAGQTAARSSDDAYPVSRRFGPGPPGRLLTERGPEPATQRPSGPGRGAGHGYHCRSAGGLVHGSRRPG